MVGWEVGTVIWETTKQGSPTGLWTESLLLSIAIFHGLFWVSILQHVSRSSRKSYIFKDILVVIENKTLPANIYRCAGRNMIKSSNNLWSAFMVNTLMGLFFVFLFSHVGNTIMSAFFLRNPCLDQISEAASKGSSDDSCLLFHSNCTRKGHFHWVYLKLQLKCYSRDFPGSPVTNTSRPQCRGPRFNPWSGN